MRTILAGMLLLASLQSVHKADAATILLLVKQAAVPCPSTGILDMSNVCNDIYVWTVLQ